MSLDSWLAPRNPRLSPKRVKLNEGSRKNAFESELTGSPPHARAVASVTLSNVAPQTANTHAWFRPPQKEPANPQNLYMTPEFRAGRPSLYGWKPLCVKSRSEIYAVHCRPDSALVVLGHENGAVTLTRPAKQEQEFVPAEIASNWPVIDVADVANRPQVLCATKQGVCTVDVTTGVAGKFSDAAETALTKLAACGTTIAAAGLAGTIGLIDSRDMAYSKYVSNAHAVQRGPLAGRANPEISAMTWAGPTMLATASPNNESVKFWDVRNMRKQAVMTTWPQTGVEKPAGGIVAMTSRDDGDVWAMSRLGKLMKFSSSLPCPTYRLESSALQVSLPNQTLDLIPGDFVQSHPLIACGGSRGTVLVTEPSDTASELEVDATLASRLDIEPLKLTNFVKWHPYTQELVCVYESLYTVHWTHTNEFLQQQNPVPVSMTPIGDARLSI